MDTNICLVIESIDREFDDSNYQDPNILQGEMKLLEDAESPEEFKADNKTLTRDKFYPNQPSTWLLNTHPNGYFDGLRQILKDDDPIFNSDNIKQVNIETPNIEADKTTYPKTKFLILGRQLAPWLDEKLAKYRLIFMMLYMLLFGAAIYAGIKNLYPEHIIVIVCFCGLVAIFIAKSIVMYLVKKAIIYNHKKAYLISEKNIHPEVYKALKSGKYSELMTPKELELVQGLCVNPKTKNDKTINHIGNNNF